MNQFAIEFDDKPPVKVAARVLQQFQYEYKDNLSASLIVCGYDNIDGPQVYSVCVGGSIVRLPFAMSGSGSAFIYGYVDTNFKNNMTKQEALELAKNAVTLATFRDNSSGGIIRVVDITKEGYTRGVIKFNDMNFPASI